MLWLTSSSLLSWKLHLKLIRGLLQLLGLLEKKNTVNVLLNVASI